MNMPTVFPVGEELPGAPTFQELICLVLDGSSSMNNLTAGGQRTKAEDVIHYLVHDEQSLLERLKTSGNTDRLFVSAVTFDNKVSSIPVRPLNQVTAADLDIQLTHMHGNNTAIGLALREAFKMSREWIEQADPNIPRFATLLLLSDGQETAGSNPLGAANEIKAWADANIQDLPRPPIMIAAAPFGTDADAGTLQAVASPNPKDGSPMCKVVLSGAELRDFFIASQRAATPAGLV